MTHPGLVGLPQQYTHLPNHDYVTAPDKVIVHIFLKNQNTAWCSCAFWMDWKNS